jgi:hypothetical protein
MNQNEALQVWRDNTHVGWFATDDVGSNASAVLVVRDDGTVHQVRLRKRSATRMIDEMALATDRYAFIKVEDELRLQVPDSAVIVQERDMRGCRFCLIATWPVMEPTAEQFDWLFDMDAFEPVDTEASSEAEAHEIIKDAVATFRPLVAFPSSTMTSTIEPDHLGDAWFNALFNDTGGEFDGIRHLDDRPLPIRKELLK